LESENLLEKLTSDLQRLEPKIKEAKTKMEAAEHEYVQLVSEGKDLDTLLTAKKRLRELGGQLADHNDVAVSLRNKIANLTAEEAKQKLAALIKSRWEMVKQLKKNPPKCPECGKVDKIRYSGDECVANKFGRTISEGWREAVQQKSIPSLVKFECLRDRITFLALLDMTDFPETPKPKKGATQYFALDPKSREYLEFATEAEQRAFIQEHYGARKAT